MRKWLPLILSENDERLCAASKTLFASLQDELASLDKKIEEIEVQLKQMAKANDTCKRLMKVPGVGILTATAIIAHMGDGKQFKNGRQFAACLGLTPKEYSSGGKQKLLGISKRGDNYIRKLLIQQARIICRWWNRKIAAENEWRVIWLQQVTQRRGKFVAAVAQANKTARILWNILAKGVEYSPDYL